MTRLGIKPQSTGCQDDALNRYTKRRFTEDGIVISNRNTQVPVRMMFLALCMIWSQFNGVVNAMWQGKKMLGNEFYCRR